MLLPTWLIEESEFINTLFQCINNYEDNIKDNDKSTNLSIKYNYIDFPIYYLPNSIIWEAFTEQGINGNVLCSVNVKTINNVLNYLCFKQSNREILIKYIYPKKPYGIHTSLGNYCNSNKIYYIIKFSPMALLQACYDEAEDWVIIMLNFKKNQENKEKMKSQEININKKNKLNSKIKPYSRYIINYALNIITFNYNNNYKTNLKNGYFYPFVLCYNEDLNYTLINYNRKSINSKIYKALIDYIYFKNSKNLYNDFDGNILKYLLETKNYDCFIYSFTKKIFTIKYKFEKIRIFAELIKNNIDLLHYYYKYFEYYDGITNTVSTIGIPINIGIPIILSNKFNNYNNPFIINNLYITYPYDNYKSYQLRSLLFYFIDNANLKGFKITWHYFEEELNYLNYVDKLDYIDNILEYIKYNIEIKINNNKKNSIEVENINKIMDFYTDLININFNSNDEKNIVSLNSIFSCKK